MSNDDGTAMEVLDQLPEAQVAILAALQPHERVSLPLIVDVTGVSSEEIDGHLAELQNLGLVELQTEPERSTMQMSASLTQQGRTLVRHRLPTPASRLAKVLGFPSARGGGRR